MTGTLILVRHGESEWNLKNLFTGWRNPDLTEKGIGEAKATGERLKKAGAIAIGKTNSPEFGYTAISKNLLFGISRNPWNPERTPGGSSGGSSAAVAGGQVPFATGSDGGGSVRIPASWCGMPGLKPSFGRIPKGPHDMLDWVDASVYGPMVRTTQDAAL